MIFISLIIEHVSLQLVLSIFLGFPHLLVNLVATIISIVRLPVPHANPAKFVFTLAARHVIAALVLLNRLLARWTWLGVRLQPSHVFALRCALIHPLFKGLTVHRQVAFCAAAKAKHTFALAGHLDCFRTQVFYHKSTASARTPLE